MKKLSDTAIDQLRYLVQNSPYYKALLIDKNISSIQNTIDLEKLPFTTKEDLHKYNDAFLCVSMDHVVDIVTTSGTTGQPVAFYLTHNDLERLSHNEQMSLETAGIASHDIVQVTTTLDKMFMAGIAYYLGLRKIGASVIRVGPGIPEIQWQNIARFKTTVLIAVPSFIIKMIDYAEKNNINYKMSSVKKIICIGEPIKNNDFSLNTLGLKITDKWPVKLYSSYASTEMSTAFTECDWGCGGHVNENLILVECIDDNGNTVVDETPGELVVTPLGVEGMPLLRFRTGDIATIYRKPCMCGRSSPRIGPIIGRKKQMIKYKGTTLFPPAISEVLRSIPEVNNFVTEVLTDEMGLDEIIVFVHCQNQNSDTEKIIKDHFRASIRVAPEIRFESWEYIETSKAQISFRKPVDFIDKRIVGQST